MTASNPVRPAVSGPRDADQASSTLQSFFDPASVALVGASRTPGKWGHELAVRLLRGADRRQVHLVSLSPGDIAGVPLHRSLTDVPGPVELVVAAVPPSGFPQVIDDGLALGARAFIAVTGGLGERGGQARETERAAVAKLRANGARLLGPNGLGALDTHSGLIATAWFDRLAEAASSVAVISQSGTVGLDFALLARRVGLGFSRFASVGNQSDVTIAELLEDLVDHAPTELVVVYCENFVDGRRLFRAAERLIAGGKPVILLAPGASRAASDAARSHTGSMTSPRSVIEAACVATGVRLVGTTAEAVDVAQLLLRAVQPSGRRVGVVADGGGYAILVADALHEVGLEVPQLSATARVALESELGTSVTAANPVDLAEAAGDPDALDRAVRTVLRSGEVDAVAVTGFVGDPQDADEGSGPRQIIVSPRTAADARRRGVPIAVQALFDESASVRALAQLPVAVYRTTGALARALDVAALGTTPRHGIPVESPTRIQTSRRPTAAVTGYFPARELLANAGVPFARAVRVGSDPADALKASAHLHYPLVIKAVDRLHKSDDGGVVLGITDRNELLEAHRDLVSRLGAQTLSIEEMADRGAGLELIIGAKRDPQFGPVVLVGFGGVLTEVMHDTQVLLAPVSPMAASDALSRLRGAALLRQTRGRPPLARDAITACVSAIGHVLIDHPEIAEIEVNPLLATPSGVIGLDARFVPAEPATRHHAEEEMK